MSRDKLPEFVMAATLARLWGISTERVRQLAKQDMIPSGARGKYPFEATLLAFAKYQRQSAVNARGDGQAERIKTARAREIEMRIAQKERVLIPLTDSIASMDQVIGNMRSELDGFAARITRDRELRYRIEEAVDGILKRASQRLAEEASALRAGEPAADAVEEDDAGPVGEDEPDLSSKRRRSGPS